MNISNKFKISNINNSFLTCCTLDCKNYSIFRGWKNEITNISNTNITGDSASFTCLYGSILRYDTLLPSGGYVTNYHNIDKYKLYKYYNYRYFI